MQDELLRADEIYIQDIVCSVVAANPQMDDFGLYNVISTMVEVSSLHTVNRILALIRINKNAFS